MNKNKILQEVNSYYTEKVLKNGATPAGVDWNSQESQLMRFDVLTSVVSDIDNSFSVIDFGCGYGAMFDYCKAKFKNFKYFGYDISEEMIKHAKEIHKHDKNSFWFTKIDEIPVADFVIASGIFNVKLSSLDENWLSYIMDILQVFNEKSNKGFAFNMLTKYSDSEYMKDYLYYADPLKIFDYCKTNFSKLVALRHDYPLYEFSIIVRK